MSNSIVSSDKHLDAFVSQGGPVTGSVVVAIHQPTAAEIVVAENKRKADEAAHAQRRGSSLFHAIG